MSHARQKRRIAREWERQMVEWAYHLGWLAGDTNADHFIGELAPEARLGSLRVVVDSEPFPWSAGPARVNDHHRFGLPNKYASWYYDGVDDGANQRIRMEIASIELDVIEAEEKGLDNV